MIMIRPCSTTVCNWLLVKARKIVKSPFIYTYTFVRKTPSHIRKGVRVSKRMPICDANLYFGSHVHGIIVSTII